MGFFGRFGLLAALISFGTIATFLGCSLIYYAKQCLTKKDRPGVRSWLRFTFPAPQWRSRSAQIDIVFYLIRKFTLTMSAAVRAALTIAIAVLVAKALAAVLGPAAHRELSAVMYIGLAIGLFLVADFANFYTHLLEHRVPWLWELHAVHHSATMMSPLTTNRMHPLADEFDNFFAAVLISLPMGVAQYYWSMESSEIFIMLAGMNVIGTLLVLDSLRHSQFPVSFGMFDKVLMSPHMHQLHHSANPIHFDKNMGNKLSIWDHLFGTAFVPPKNESLEYGLGLLEGQDQRPQDYEHVLDCLLLPIRNIISQARKKQDDIPAASEVETVLGRT